MIGKLILTIIILGGGAFLLLSDSFEEFISPYAGATASEIEDIKNDPDVQAKFEESFETMYEKFTMIKLVLSEFFVT